jgi:hypothetical protein
MQKFLIAALAASLLVPTAVLADSGALAPGKPAGVQAAQMDRTTAIVALGAAAIFTGVAIAASSCCHHSNAPIVTPAPVTTIAP